MNISLKYMRGLPRLLTVCLLGMFVALIAVSSVQSEGSAQAANKVVGRGESIQAAINAADPGDTIVVRGVHREDVVIRKNGIKLRGDDAVIEAPARAKADSPCSKAVGPEAICVLGDFNPETGEITGPRVSDVSVSGFTIRGFKDKDAFVIDVYAARNTTAVGNRITGNVANGIAFGGSVNTTIAKNHVIGSPETAEHGILVDNFSSRTKIVNNVVRSYASGVDVAETTNTTIAGNDLIGNRLGVLVIESTGTKILSNDITDSTLVGTVVLDSTGTKIVPTTYAAPVIRASPSSGRNGPTTTPRSLATTSRAARRASTSQTLTAAPSPATRSTTTALACSSKLTDLRNP